MAEHVALLRGINVGGKNIIAMSDLRACFERHGFGEVATYIQSGNVIFDSAGMGRPELARVVEEMLASELDYRGTVVIRSRRQLRNVVTKAPPGFGAEPKKHRYDVIFLEEPLTARSAMGSVVTREGVDEAHPGPGVLYFSRLIAQASRSKLTKLVSLPIYQRMTIRNWNTTTKLLALMNER